MKILVILALSAFCVSAEELVRSKRGWGYEPTPPPPPPPTQPPGGWGPPPPPPPPPTNPPQPGGWGPPPQPPTSRPGWGWPQPQPTPGWGSSSYNYGYNYPSYNNYGRYPRRWGQTRYNRYAEMERERPSRYSDFSTIRGGSEPYRRSSSLM